MIYIIAEYNERGLKLPRIVSLGEAQAFYSRKCIEDGGKPGDLSKQTHSCCFTDLKCDDFLWVIGTVV